MTRPDLLPTAEPGPVAGAAPTAAPGRPGGRRRAPQRLTWSLGGAASPLVLLLVAFPLWWALGLGVFIWPALAVPMVLRLVRRGRADVPPGFGLWLAFLGWVLLSATQVQGSGPGLTFTYRLGMYLSATVAFLFVYNLDSAPRPTVVGRALAAFWVITVAGGFLGMLAPSGGFSTVTESLFSAAALENEFVFRLVHPLFADVQTFLGYQVARPVAPFLYTNYWGSVFAMTLPFAIWQLRRASTHRARRWWTTLLVLSLVPQVWSLNRGMALSIAVGLVYWGWHASGRRVAMRKVVTWALIIAALVALTPLRQLVTDRFATGHSNQGRTVLYEEAIRMTTETPLVGRGSPQRLGGSTQLPPVGTQGQLWLVMVSQGFVGLALFLAWWISVFRRTRHATSALGRACHVTVLIFILQLPVYDMIPYQLHLAMIVAALALREVTRTDPAAAARHPSTAAPPDARSTV